MSARTIAVKKNVLSANMDKASQVRAYLDQHDVKMLNVMSSPGSGKTSLITRTIQQLSAFYNIAVIEGDIESSIDADKISRMNVPAIQINTGGGCHLNANMIEDALSELDQQNIDLLFIENVGNLVCTADFDLGAHKNIVILSVPEGDDKPHKYPTIFMEADIVLISKIDVLPYFDFNMEDFQKTIHGMNPKATICSFSAKTGEGLENWISWVTHVLRK